MTLSLWCRYPYSPRICVKLRRLAPERTSSETMSFMTSFSSSKLCPLRICFLFPYATSSPQTVGVIYKTKQHSFRVLDQNGQARLVKPHQISTRRNSVRAVANDAEGHKLRANDNVKEVDGLVCSFFSFCCALLSNISFIGTKRTRHPYSPVILRFLAQPRRHREQRRLCHPCPFLSFACSQG